ncbi:hypothetical protein Q4599_04420 [Cellulophaga lytica]|uniref:hypothetical protein n=1 Tax=Cellulophaga lytica TaxID=979 RepID=UPI0026E255F9|nr:hypothetical protein [Cellulophaga lytica]MDO6852810.1 hypothetical protein [Cellulophaga lytica]
MKIKQSFSEIVSFSLKENILININGNITELDGKKIGEINDARKSFKLNSDEIIILDSLNKPFYLFSGNLLIQNQRISTVTDKYFLTYSKKPRRYAIFDKQQMNCLFEANSSFGDVVLNDLIFSYNSGIIYCYNILSGEYILQFNLSNVEDKISSIIEFSGIHKNTLVCTLENGGVLGVDIDKAEQVFYFSNAQLRSGLYQKEEDSPIFIGLKHWTYLELNAEKGELIKKVDLQPQLKVLGDIPKESPCWLSINTTKYENNLIYFFADKNYVGVFDIEKTEIIDFHQFNFLDKKTTLKSGAESLQIKGNEIYCLDTNNDLHILETTPLAQSSSSCRKE